jgi:hypothetical protein
VAVWGRVLAKWAQHDAVLEGKTSELQRLEELGDIFLAILEESGAGWRVLERCEIWNVRRGTVDEVGWCGRHCESGRCGRSGGNSLNLEVV